jgi:hypothetical protein
MMAGGFFKPERKKRLMHNIHHDEALPPRQNVQIKPSDDKLTLDSAAVAKAVTTEYGLTLLVSAVAGALFDLPDGDYIGQRKTVKADVSGAGTCVASAAALAKLAPLSVVGAAGLTGFAANDAVSAMVLDAADESVLLEWTGTKWCPIYASAGVLTLA